MSGLHSKCRGGGVALAHPHTGQIYLHLVTSPKRQPREHTPKPREHISKPANTLAPAHPRVYNLPSW